MWERDVWNVDDSGDATRCDGRETVGRFDRMRDD